MTRQRSIACLLLIVALAALAPASGRAQDYPSRPIRLIITTPAGGLVDVMGRILTDELGARLGQPIVGLRYSNVYGPGEDHKGKFASMIHQLAKQMRAGKRPRIFTAGEQEFFERKGFKEIPKRCKPCRDARKSKRSNSDGNGGNGYHANGNGYGNGGHANGYGGGNGFAGSNGVAARADPLIDQWKRETAHEEEA